MIRITAAALAAAAALALTGCASDDAPAGPAAAPTAVPTEEAEEAVEAVDPTYLSDKQIRAYLEARWSGDTAPHQIEKVRARYAAPDSPAWDTFLFSATSSYLYNTYDSYQGERTIDVTDGTATNCQVYDGEDICGTLTNFVGDEGLVVSYDEQGSSDKKPSPVSADNYTSAGATTPVPGVGTALLAAAVEQDGDLWVAFTVKNTSGTSARTHSPVYVTRDGRQLPGVGDYVLGPDELMPGAFSSYLVKFENVKQGGTFTLSTYGADGHDTGPIRLTIPKP